LQERAARHVTFPNYVATFSSCGGTLVGWHLTDARYVNDPTKGDIVRKAETRVANDPVTSRSTIAPRRACR